MAGIKQRGPRSENYKRTVIRDGVSSQVVYINGVSVGTGNLSNSFLHTFHLQDLNLFILLKLHLIHQTFMLLNV